MSIQDQIKKSLDQHSINFRSITAYVLFGAIILVFVLVSFPGGRATLGQGAMAEVNGQLISAADLKGELNRLEQFYSRMFGGNFNMQAQRQLLENQALENVISMEIMAQEATASGVITSDTEVRDFLFEIPAFQERGRFDLSRYKNYLMGASLSSQEFENRYRKDAQRMRVRRLFEAVEHPSQIQEKAQEEMNGLKFNIQFAKLDREALSRAITVSPAQVQDYLKSPDNMKKIEVDYETNKSTTYTSEEQVKARHILLKVKEGDANDDQTALTKIMDIKARATKEDFAKLATQWSQDEGSQAKGGDLGFFGRGQMVPPFEKAAFEAKVGDLVGPIKTQFGYHIIKVEGRKEKQVRSLDEVKSEIAKKLMAESVIDEKLLALEGALTKKDQGTIDAMLKDLKIGWEETGEYDLKSDSIPKLVGNESLQEAAWSLTQAGQWLDHLVRDGSFRYVLKLKDLKKNPLATPVVAGSPANGMNGVEASLFEGWLSSARASYKVQKSPSARQ